MADIPFTDGSGDMWSEELRRGPNRPLSREQKLALIGVLLGMAVIIVVATVIKAIF